jgi:hypothetical protein
MNYKLEYIGKINKDVEKKCRIYGAFNSMRKLHSKDIEQYFTNCTYKKCIISINGL